MEEILDYKLFLFLRIHFLQKDYSTFSDPAYPYFTLTVPEFPKSRVHSANFALQPTNSLEKPNHHPTNL